MRRVLAALAVALFASATQAQAPPVTSYQAPWSPVGALVTLAVTNASGNVQMGWATQSPLPNPTPPSAIITNTGANAAYCTAGGSSVAATTTGSASQPVTFVPSGGSKALALNGNQYIACITASSTTNVTIEAGSGSASNDATPGGGSAGGMTVTANNSVNPTAINNQLVSGITLTTLPTQAAGTLGLGGTSTTPTFGANGEGDVWLSTTGGLNFGGQGSSNDVTVYDKNGTIACLTSSGTLSWTCGVIAANGTTANPTAGTLKITGEVAAPSLSANGQGFIYLLSTTGGIGLSGQGSTNDITINNKSGSAAIVVPTGTQNITVGGSITASLSAAAGANQVCTGTAGTAFTTVASGTACASSALRFKNPKGWFDITQAPKRISFLRPGDWTYKDTRMYGNNLYGGIYADDVKKMDPLCVTYDKKDGGLFNYYDRCVMAWLTADMQYSDQRDSERDKKISNMEKEIEILKSEIARR
jgi:hypothetical protein